MEFKNNVPFIKEGLEVSRISFSGGRTAASIANHGGLTHLNYYGKQRFGDIQFYKSPDMISGFFHLFRFCVRIDGNLYYLEFNQTNVYPFGYESRCELAEVFFKHGMYLLNDALIYTLEIIRNPKGKSISASVLQLMDHVSRVNKPTRTWGSFDLDKTKNAVIVSVKDCYPETKEEAMAALKKLRGNNPHNSYLNSEPISSETFMGFVSDAKMQLAKSPESHRDYRFDLNIAGKSASFAIVFGHEGKKKFETRISILRDKAFNEAETLLENYRQKMKSQPQIELENKAAQSVLMNVPSIIDSLKVRDIPGGMRAKDNGYWIWGWDSMVHSDALCFAGDTGFVAEMLDYYKRTADPQIGIFHAATLEGKPYHGMAFPAQCLYAVMLYNAYLFTGDRGLLEKYYSFAKWILDRAGEDEVGGTGLIRGLSLYPDYPQYLGEDGDDISAFNNGIYYQALKTMSQLAEELGRRDEAADFAEKAVRLLDNWQRLYDEDKGFFYFSLRASDFSPRKFYPHYAILWVTPFAGDLVEKWKDVISKFMKDNFTMRHGIRSLPKWDKGYMYTFNEGTFYMPVVENFYREMMKISKDTGELGHLLANIEWFWNQLTVPEGLICVCENHGIALDNPGCKQGFAAKAWLSMFYHVICGINFDIEGISFSAADPGVDVAINGLKIRGRKLDINIAGRGWKIKSLTLDGREIKSPFRIPFTELKETRKIKLLRSEK
jgi:hypothetical protein